MTGRKPVTRVSAIIPAHNGEPYIAQAIESVLGQIGIELELIVIDDCSSDRTAEIVQTYPSVQLVRLPRPGGNAYTSANVGVALAQSEYIAILHQDDLWHPTKLATQVAMMDQDPRIGLSYSAIAFIGSEGKLLSCMHSPLGRSTRVVEGEVELRYLCIQNYINVCNAVVRRRALEEAGGFREDLWFAGEWAAWLRLATIGRIAYADEVLSSFRIHAHSQTQTRSHDVDAFRAQLLSVLDAFFATPGLAREVLDRRRLARANVEVSTALLSAYWSEPASALAALARLAVLLRPWEVPALLHASRLIPRAQARIRATGGARPSEGGVWRHATRRRGAVAAVVNGCSR